MLCGFFPRADFNWYLICFGIRRKSMSFHFFFVADLNIFWWHYLVFLGGLFEYRFIFPATHQSVMACMSACLSLFSFCVCHAQPLSRSHLFQPMSAHTHTQTDRHANAQQQWSLNPCDLLSVFSWVQFTAGGCAELEEENQWWKKIPYCRLHLVEGVRLFVCHCAYGGREGEREEQSRKERMVVG